MKTISLPERPFPIMWEQSPNADGCTHVWETVSAEQYPGHFVTVDRCETCHTPRCDSTNEATQCLERRHHSTLHIYPNGYFEPVGGYLRPESPVHQTEEPEL